MRWSVGENFNVCSLHFNDKLKASLLLFLSVCVFFFYLVEKMSNVNSSSLTWLSAEWFSNVCSCHFYISKLSRLCVEKWYVYKLNANRLYNVSVACWAKTCVVVFYYFYWLIKSTISRTDHNPMLAQWYSDVGSTKDQFSFSIGSLLVNCSLFWLLGYRKTCFCNF